MIGKVLIVVSTDLRNGAEQVINSLSIYLANKGTDCQILILTKKKNDFWKIDLPCHKVKYLNAPNKYVGLLPLAIKLMAWRGQHDYIITTQTMLGSFIGFMKRLGLAKTGHLVARESTVAFNRFKGSKLAIYKIWYKVGYPGVDLIIAQTKEMASVLKNNLSLKTGNKVRVIPNPIDLENIQKRGEAKLTFDYQQPYIVSAGRLIPEKGYDVLIRSFDKLARKDLKLLILGHGPEFDRLYQIIVSLGLEERVHLLGHQDNPMPILKHASLCVVSSNIEGFPNVLLQMMALNGHVVSTRCADGIQDIPGLDTCEPGSISSLAHLMASVLDRERPATYFIQYLESRNYSCFWEKVKSVTSNRISMKGKANL